MSNKKQTAVQWLHEKLAKSSEEDLVGNINIYFKQAKELEKQQIIDANNDGYKVGRKTKKFETAEQYYTQTYEN